MCSHLDGYVPYGANAILDFLEALDASANKEAMGGFFDCSGWPVELFRQCGCPDRPTGRDGVVYVSISDNEAREWAEARL